MSNNGHFKNPFLNKLAKTNALVAITLYYIISVLIISYGFLHLSTAGVSTILVIVAGLLAYSLIEYVVHRFMYHSGENYMDEQNWQYKVHGVHHDVPKEKDLLALPIPLALPVIGLLFYFFYIPMGEYVFFFFPGFLSGYATYLLVHYKVHSSKPPKNVFRYLWKHHLIHHYSDDDKAFGVSSPLWDIVFGTMPEKKKVAGKK